MDKKNMARQIRRSYLRNWYKAAGRYLVIVAVFLAIAAIYGYMQILKNMLYAAELALFLGVLFTLEDYLSYSAKCRALFFAVQKEEDRARGLPKADSLPEELYQQLLAKEEQERSRLLTGYDEKQKDMTDYYTMWTHQIKTPIAAMRLLLQSREEAANRTEGQDGEDGQRELEELFKIEQYIQMALYFARLDSLSSDFLFREYDVREIVKQAVRKYSVLFLRSGLSLRMEEFEIRAVTDEKWLCFVVEQIFSNALKYTRQGGIAIYGADADGGLVQGRASYLAVEDTGIGIRKSDLPRIFERGFTGYNGRIDQKSTGLGLYLCDQVMGRLSHTIKVESVLGKGTKVVFGFVQ